MTNRAIFLDRDGTLVHKREYPARPEDLVLFDDTLDYLRRLKLSGFKLIVVTNQSGLARGYFSLQDLDRMHRHLSELLRASGAAIDAIYYCPHHPDGVDKQWSMSCNCRKPKPGMILRAQTEWQVSLEQSWFIGDTLDDVEAGNRAGCQTILVNSRLDMDRLARLRNPGFVVDSTAEALSIVLSVETT
jgi:D-glycero-D-manno-heptose 1,7-bisphosphate phosphatase